MQHLVALAGTKNNFSQHTHWSLQDSHSAVWSQRSERVNAATVSVCVCVSVYEQVSVSSHEWACLALRQVAGRGICHHHHHASPIHFSPACGVGRLDKSVGRVARSNMPSPTAHFPASRGLLLEADSHSSEWRWSPLLHRFLAAVSRNSQWLLMLLICQRGRKEKEVLLPLETTEELLWK